MWRCQSVLWAATADGEKGLGVERRKNGEESSSEDNFLVVLETPAFNEAALAQTPIISNLCNQKRF